MNVEQEIDEQLMFAIRDAQLNREFYELIKRIEAEDDPLWWME